MCYDRADLGGSFVLLRNGQRPLASQHVRPASLSTPPLPAHTHGKHCAYLKKRSGARCASSAYAGFWVVSSITSCAEVRGLSSTSAAFMRATSSNDGAKSLPCRRATSLLRITWQ